MLKKFAIALVSTALIAGPALAQSNNAGTAPATAAQPVKPEVKTDGKGTAAQSAKPDAKADVKAGAKEDVKTGAAAKPAAQTPEVKKDTAKPEKKTQLNKGEQVEPAKKPVEKTRG